jgi:hypothetical protein
MARADGRTIQNEHCSLAEAERCEGIEYWMIYRGPGFLAVVWFGSSLTPFPPPVRNKPDRRHTGGMIKRDNQRFKQAVWSLGASNIKLEQSEKCGAFRAITE